MKIEDSLDERNQKLFSALSSNGVEFEFEMNEEFISWAVQPKYKYKIVANSNENSPASLAHELLHIYCNIHGFLNTFVIMDIFKSNNLRFKSEHLSNIQNLLAHLRMFPLFIEMGYPPEEFTMNEEDKFLRETLLPNFFSINLEYLNINITEKKPPIELITTFLQLMLLLKQTELEEKKSGLTNNAEQYSRFLKECDEQLFNSINEELDNWIESGTYSNYDFYMRINHRLGELGYPIEMDWDEWESQELTE